MKLRVLTEETDHEIDVMSLYADLSADGTKTNTLLLESADSVTRQGEKSIIVSETALQITCLGRQVFAQATSIQGKKIIEHLRACFSGHVADYSSDDLLLQFNKLDPSLEMSKRLLIPSPLDVLRALSTGLQNQHMFILGIFAYDFIDVYEELPEAKSDQQQFPDYIFWVPEQAIIVNHLTQKAQMTTFVFDESQIEELTQKHNIFTHTVCSNRKRCFSMDSIDVNAPMDIAAEADVSDAQFQELVKTVKSHIEAGDVFQIVPSRTFSLPCKNSFSAYQILRRLNKSPYMYFVQSNDFTIFGASPETSIKVSGTPKIAQIRPIAGTRPRGLKSDGSIDLDLDSRYEAELRLSVKELAEHMMLVDLARNDIARVSKPGTRYVEKLLTLDKYSHVMHLVSYVRGELKEGLDALHAYQAAMNMGTLVGAPKVKAAELLRKYENSKRNIYGGAICYITAEGEFDSAITIRSALVKNDIAYVRAGSGIVYDSDPIDEAEETKHKSKAILKAIRLAS